MTPDEDDKIIASAEAQTDPGALSAAASTEPPVADPEEPVPPAHKTPEERIDAIERVLRLLGYGELLDA